MKSLLLILFILFVFIFVSKKRKTQIKDDTQILMNNEHFQIIIENFIRKMPSQYFLIPEYIGALDYYIIRKYNNKSLDFLETEAKSKLRVENKDIKKFFMNEYDLFLQLVSKKYDDSSDLRIQEITYNSLKMGKIDYYSKIFENNYGSYFRKWDYTQKLILNDIVNRYIKIEDIVKDDPVLIGQLTCYVISEYNLTSNYLSLYSVILNILEPKIERLRLDSFEKSLLSKPESLQYTIDDVDLMGGLEFEQFIAELFSKMGYLSKVTKASGDQGIDVIAEKNGKKIGIQTKCYSSKVTNSATQEVVAGMHHYRLDKGMVITNNWFTQSAQDLAQSNMIVLWDRNLLKEKLDEITF